MRQALRKREHGLIKKSVEGRPRRNKGFQRRGGRRMAQEGKCRKNYLKQSSETGNKEKTKTRDVSSRVVNNTRGQGKTPLARSRGWE